MANAKLVESPFTITETTSGVTLNTVTAVASTWYEVAEYQVPLGMAVLIDPTNYVFASLFTEAATPVAITAGTARLIKLNAPETEMVEIWAGPIAIFKDVGDERQRPRLKTAVLLNSSEKLRLECYSTSTADGANCTFAIEAKALYPPVRGLA